MEVTFQRNEQRLFQALTAGRFSSWPVLDEQLRLARRSLAKGFDRLLALDEVDVELFEHQRYAAARVLQHMRGRALLADEVGLGKTIEAGIILKEYMVRGLARDVLILVPAPLTEQWRTELREKLAIEARINRVADGWEQGGCIIASLDTAKRAEHAARIRTVSWDVVIVDEAHRLKNRHTAAWRFVDGLRKKYLLLLTATPIQNDLEELYNMMTLLKPGLLQTYSAFRDRFMIDKRSPKEVERLREYVRDVMIRSTRSECNVPFAQRHVHSVPVRQTADEQAFYDDVLHFARAVYVHRGRANVLPLILLLRELCSSPQAAGRTLAALSASDELDDAQRAQAARLVHRARALAATSSKLAAAVRLIRGHHEPLVVFTQFLATQDALANALRAHGVVVTCFHGGMNDEQRREAVDTFRRQGGVLVSTEAGGEGQNLQFCRTVMNYDLPWNPMRVEQRIGRVHRLGQARDVLVINLYMENSVDAYVHRLLHEKVRLFQQVIGDLDLILAAVEDDERTAPLETTIGRLVLETDKGQALDDAFARLGERLAQARQEREEVERRNSVLLNERGNCESIDLSVTDCKAGSESTEFLGAVMHPLCVDMDFIRGATADTPITHPVLTAMRRAEKSISFTDVPARLVSKRVVVQRHVLFWFKLAYKSDETREQLHAVLVDPVTETTQPAPGLSGVVDIGSVGRAVLIADGAHSYVMQRLYEAARRYVENAARRLGRHHQAQADTRLARDRARLEKYYEGLRAEALHPITRELRRLEAAHTREQLSRAMSAASGEPQSSISSSSLQARLAHWEAEARKTMARLAAEQQSRLEELAQKYAVRAEATSVAAALLWVPRVEYRYKLLGSVRREIAFYYDPLRDTFVDFVCEACGGSLTTVHSCSEGELVCSECYAPCAACDTAMCADCVPRRCHVCERALCHECGDECPAAVFTPNADTSATVVCPDCARHMCGHCMKVGAFLVV